MTYAGSQMVGKPYDNQVVNYQLYYQNTTTTHYQERDLMRYDEGKVYKDTHSCT